MTAEISQELEATRTEISRGAMSMPRDLKAQTGSIKRAVGDQLQALNELTAIVERSGLDAAAGAPRRSAAPVERPAPVERVAPRPSAVPVPRAAPTAPLRAPAPLAARAEPAAKSRGWLGDLLNKASTDDAGSSAGSKGQATEQGLEALDVISGDIARLVDSDAVGDVWERYMSGERGVFTRRLYTLKGQQTFDEVRRRYRRDADFRETVDRYIEEFERLLKDVAAEGRDGAVARTYLVSDTGKVYTMLAHSADRFE
jgi:hypothetical protein